MAGYMSKTSGDSDQSSSDGPKSSPRSDITYLLATAADTTWRMFVPAVGFTLLGAWADRHFDTKPWLMVLGIVVGVAGAIMLVRKQLRATNTNANKERSDS